MDQHRLHIAADPLRTDTCDSLHTQAEVFAQVIDVQDQRIVGPFFAAEGLDTLPSLRGLFGNTAHSAVPVVEQGAEQGCRRGHATATLGQGQGGMFVTEQRGESRVGRLDPGAYTLFAHGDPQRQGIDKHPQRPFGALTALHPPHQHGAEHHILPARDPPQ